MSYMNLERAEWNYLLNLLGDRPWKEVNALIMKMGAQLQRNDEKRMHPGSFDFRDAEHHQRGSATNDGDILRSRPPADSGDSGNRHADSNLADRHQAE